MKKVIFLIFIPILFVEACSKPPEVLDVSLLGKWNIKDYRYTEALNNVIVLDDLYTGSSADFMDFKINNTVNTFRNRFGYVYNYQIFPDNIVLIDSDVYFIQSLTPNSARLYLKKTSGINYYYEETYNLIR